MIGEGVYMVNWKRFHSFDIEKIIQVLAYIQQKTECLDKLKLIKLLFFADRMHLRKYLSFISFDIYYALRSGPAASKTLDVINRSKTHFSDTAPENLMLLDKIDIVNKNTRIIREKNTGYMSKVEMNVLDSVCEIFGNFSAKALVNITHDYPEWKRYQTWFSSQSKRGRLIVIEDFFKNPDIKESPALQKYFNGIDPLYEDEEHLNDVKEIYLENEAIKSANQ
jgi:uncharacterized phage-associated protein